MARTAGGPGADGCGRLPTDADRVRTGCGQMAASRNPMERAGPHGDSGAGPAGARLCGAKARSTGQPCRRRAMANGRCRNHGGASTGPRVWKAGGARSAKLEPLRQLLAGYAGQVDLLDLRPTLTLFDAIIDKLLVRAEEKGDSPDFRQQAAALAKKAWDAYRRDPLFASAPLQDLVKLTEEGWLHDHELLEAVKLAERRNQRAEAARLLQLRETETLTLQQALGFVGQILELAFEVLPRDQATRFVQAVERGYAGRLTAGGPGGSETPRGDAGAAGRARSAPRG